MLKRFLAIILLFVGITARGAIITPVNIGNTGNDGAGDSFRAAMIKLNTSLTNLNNAIGGTNATIPAAFASVIEMAAADPSGYLTNIYEQLLSLLLPQVAGFGSLMDH